MFPEKNLTVFNVDYSLAPESKMPRGVFDGFASIKYIYENAEYLNIDKNQICVSGESGGALICCGAVLRLMEEGLGHYIKLCIPIIPMVISKDIYFFFR